MNDENIDISHSPPQMTGAMIKHFVTKDHVAYVADDICIRGGQACVYAPHKKKGEKNAPSYETCEFKNKMDDFLYGALKSGLVLQIEIAHCDHYQPGDNIEFIADQMETVGLD